MRVLRKCVAQARDRVVGYTEAGNAFKARIARENAKGGVNGRKIDAMLMDDARSNNLTAAHDCVQQAQARHRHADRGEHGCADLFIDVIACVMTPM